MKTYIKISNLKYPCYEGDIRLDHPEIGPDFLCPSTYYIVNDVDLPEYDSNLQSCIEIFPENVDGIWYKNYQIKTYTAEELDYNSKMIVFLNNKSLSELNQFDPNDPSTYELVTDK